MKLYQDLGFALSFGNRTPCKRSIYLGANRLERLEPEYNPTFWKLVNMLESELKIILMPISVLLKKVLAFVPATFWILVNMLESEMIIITL